MTTGNIVMWVIQFNIVDWAYFKILILLETLKNKNHTPEESYVVCRRFVPISWMCKKQKTVSHSFSESEIISLDAGLRMDGILALDVWDVVIDMLHSSNDVPPTQKKLHPKANQKEPQGKQQARFP